MTDQPQTAGYDDGTRTGWQPTITFSASDHPIEARTVEAQTMSCPTLPADDLLLRLQLGQIAACNCDTMTPAWQAHSGKCRYRLLCEATEAIEKLRTLAELAHATCGRGNCNCVGARAVAMAAAQALSSAFQ